MDLKRTFGNLKRLPVWAWMLFLYAALFLRDLSENLSVGHLNYAATVADLNASFPDFASVFTWMSGMEWLSWIINPVIYVLLFEVVTSVIVSLAMGRRALLVQKAYIVYDFRIFYVGATLATAVLSPIMLSLPVEYAAYYMDLIKIPVYSAFYVAYYWFSGKNAIVWGQRGSIWSIVATIVGIYFVADGFFFFVQALSAANRPTGVIVMASLRFAFALIAAVSMFVFIKVLRADEKRNPPPPPPAPDEPEEKPEIFKGFGF